MTTKTKRKNRQRENQQYFFDYSLLFIVFFLLGFGLIMIYSASSYEAYEMMNGNAAHFFNRQALAVGVGLCGMVVTSSINYHIWWRLAPLTYGVSMILILLVLSPWGVESHGARRWIRLFGISSFQFQPAEVAKIAIILCMAVAVCKLGRKVGTWRGIVILVALVIPLVLLIRFVTNNLSSALIVLGIFAVMFFVAVPGYKWFLWMAAAAAALVAGVIYMALNGGDGFRFARIVVWLDPESDPVNIGFQTMQGLYAIGSGGIWGKGLGQSMQKLDFLPEAQNDMIFSIICEELGLFGGISVIVMFVMLIWRMMIIANNAPDLFGSMLVVGVVGHIAIQAILNIGVVTNTIPNTGISLPFISYGGTSVVFLLMEIGLVFNVARRIQLKEI